MNAREPARRLVSLEALRGIAGTYVFFHHAIRINVPDAAWAHRFLVFGQAAVMAFFVLSGFVIEHATLGRKPDMTLREYVSRRFVRLYPLLIVALALAWATASIARGQPAELDFRALVGNLLQLQDYGKPGNLVGPFLGNSPLWSLSYEWWFYLLYFAIVRAAPHDHGTQRVVVATLSAVGFVAEEIAPSQWALFAAYFPLWWAGVELAREYRRTGSVSLGGQRASIMMLLGLTLAWGALVLRAPAGLREHPGLEFRHATTTLALLVFALVWVRLGRPGLRLLLPFERLAPYCYALYVLHLPVVQLGVAEQATHGWVELAWVTVVVFAVAWFFEGPFQQRVGAWLGPRLLGSAPRPSSTPAAVT